MTDLRILGNFESYNYSKKSGFVKGNDGQRYPFYNSSNPFLVLPTYGIPVTFLLKQASNTRDCLLEAYDFQPLKKEKRFSDASKKWLLNIDQRSFLGAIDLMPIGVETFHLIDGIGSIVNASPDTLTIFVEKKVRTIKINRFDVLLLDAENYKQLLANKMALQTLQNELNLTQQERNARELFLQQIQTLLNDNFLSVDKYFSSQTNNYFMQKNDLMKIKSQFVKKWCGFNNYDLDEEQLEAVAATEGDIQVVARAGSGKTRTLVTRAIFLQQQCHISPDELLLLAFNNSAADEIEERIKTTVGSAPHIMTFHALAYAIVHPDEELIYDDTSAFQQKLSREIQDVIDEHLRSPKQHTLIRDIMLLHFHEDWENIIKNYHFLDLDERRKLPFESLKGDFVKSFGEKKIANILFENNVEYKYERNFRWNGINYRPDFTILTGNNKGIVIEYFGFQGEPDYDEMSEQKRQFWQSKPDWKLLEYSPSDITRSGICAFEKRLIEDLKALGILTRKRTDEEIWDLIQVRAIDRFTKAIRSFVSRCRKINLVPYQLEEKIKTHIVISDAEKKFLSAALSIYDGYIQKLQSNFQEDYDGLMWRAIELVNSGQTQFARNKGQERGDLKNLKFIMIDEFQDFSEMFYQLCKAIRRINQKIQFFCVGDDWQAINEFAGSELRFFLDFSQYFQNTSRFTIAGNYRSPNSIVQVGNALMHSLGTPAVAKKISSGDVNLCFLDEFSPSEIERSIHNGDEITPAILRLLKHYLNLGKEIVLLSRRNGIPWYINYSNSKGKSLDPLQKFRDHLASFFQESDRKRIHISNTHKYKGCQEDVVIVLDAIDRSYPLIHPNWIFLRILGESIQNIIAAERRLFYVALTRPEETLIVITERNQISPFVKDIEALLPLQRINWSEYSPPPSLTLEKQYIEVRVKNAYEVKEHLKKLGYAFDDKTKQWCKSFGKEGFIFDHILQQNWINEKVEIFAYSETQEIIFRNGPQDRQRRNNNPSKKL